PLEECRVVIIGDTPKDVAAAQAMGAESIGVGTGSFGPAQLMACGATAAFRHFGEDGVLKALLAWDRLARLARRVGRWPRRPHAGRRPP
ncbi:MAG TPA: HAD hydrolase-like protein, partial [Vulgatibacter sp.]